MKTECDICGVSFVVKKVKKNIRIERSSFGDTKYIDIEFKCPLCNEVFTRTSEENLGAITYEQINNEHSRKNWEK